MGTISLTVGESAMLRMLASRYDAGERFSLRAERSAGGTRARGIFQSFTDGQLERYGGLLAEKGLLDKDGDEASVTEFGVACFEAMAGESASNMRSAARQGMVQGG